ncbi:heavy metal translocating P-type ATPase [Finegoldia magna]|uniref:heavy metal translocating P-type ATPase n=1 Tax=Finegoldia magna TaxID=1260 RepID=UPI000B917066|nr:heavy metal translocating P-type ATPase [Finegoldia magna]MDU1010702.1 heavy metal translocating P-type ATPase [Finegoldia magna]OXZ39532.1 heavy metal translocating P-type ATPase [Finegoldia magna]
MEEIKLKIQGMSCEACAARIEKVLNKYEYIDTVNVNLLQEYAYLKLKEGYDIETIVDKIKKAGYDVPVKTSKFDIEGMSCQSCASRIEKVLNKNNFKDVNVNLLQNSLTVSFYEGYKTNSEVKRLVDKAGYSAEIKTDNKIANEKNITEYEKLKRDFIISAIFSIPLFSAMFFHMAGVHTILNNGYFQWALATVVQFYIGRRYYVNAYKSLRGGGANMDVLIALGTSAAYFYSIYHVLIGSDQLYFESSAVVITLILLGKVFEKRAKTRTTDAISKLMGLQAKKANVIKNGKTIETDIEDVMVGDKILVKPGEKIAVDGIIIEGSSSIDESMITGESMPVRKQVGDECIGSTINKNGSFVFEAKKIGEDTVLSQIVKLVEDAQSNKAPIQRLADKISSVFVPSVIGIAVITFVITYFVTKQFDRALLNSVSVLVIACPCSLGLATPTAIMVGSGKGAELGILIKSAEVLETANKIDAVILDKTGTITNGKPEVVDYKSEDADFLKIVSSIEKNSEHPLADAVVKEYEKNSSEFYKVEDFDSITGKGLSAKINSDNYYIGNEKLMRDNNINVNVDIQKYQSQGNTVVLVGKNDEFYGYILIADKIKESSPEAVSKLKDDNIDVYMITGDSENTAKHIAEKANIDHVIAECLPKDKSDKVLELKNQGKKVGMVGDGINDAPALATSDVGFSVGTGTDVAIEASDITIINGDLNKVNTAIRLSHRVIKTIKQNLFWAFFYNVIGIPIAAFGFLNPMIAGAAMAFSSVTVVTNSLRIKNFKEEK